jgi:hypothetical protein
LIGRLKAAAFELTGTHEQFSSGSHTNKLSRELALAVWTVMQKHGWSLVNNLRLVHPHH